MSSGHLLLEGREETGASNGRGWREQAHCGAKCRSMAEILQRAESKEFEPHPISAFQIRTPVASGAFPSRDATPGRSFQEEASVANFAVCFPLERGQRLPREPVVGRPNGSLCDVGHHALLTEDSSGAVEIEGQSGRTGAVGAIPRIASSVWPDPLSSDCEGFAERTQTSGRSKSGGTDEARPAGTLADRRPNKRGFLDDANVTVIDENDRDQCGSAVLSDGGPKHPSMACAEQERRSMIFCLTERVMQMKKEVKEVEQCFQVWRERKQELLLAGGGAVNRTKVVDQEELFRAAKIILEQVKRHRMSPPFLIPVDVERYGLFDYYQIVERPMDLGTIQHKLDAKSEAGYNNVRELCEDIRLVFRNAMEYHSETTQIYKMAQTLSKCFEKKWNQFETKLLELEARKTRQTLYESSCENVQNAEAISARLFKQLYEAEKKLMVLVREALLDCRRVVSEKKGKVNEILVRLCDDKEEAQAAAYSNALSKKTAILDDLDKKNSGGTKNVQKAAVRWSLYRALKRQSHRGVLQAASSRQSTFETEHLATHTAKRPRSFPTARPRTSYEGLLDSNDLEPDHDRCRINNGQYTYRCKAKVVQGFKTCHYHLEQARKLRRRKIREKEHVEGTELSYSRRGTESTITGGGRRASLDQMAFMPFSVCRG